MSEERPASGHTGGSGLPFSGSTSGALQRVPCGTDRELLSRTGVRVGQTARSTVLGGPKESSASMDDLQGVVAGESSQTGFELQGR